MYQPTLGTFTARDPMLQGQPVLFNVTVLASSRAKSISMLVQLYENLYAYVAIPTTYTDPSGLMPLPILPISIFPPIIFFPAIPPPKFGPPGVTNLVKDCFCNEKVHCVLAIGPIDCNTAANLATQAKATAQATGLPGPHNGPMDAFRHCFWSCQMAQVIGVAQAKSVGDIHEACGGNPAKEQCMDLWNNAMGRFLGDITPPIDCGAACLSELLAGNLQDHDQCPPGHGTPFVTP